MTGLCRRYYSEYDPEILKGQINSREYEGMLATFNETLCKLWPCPTSMCLGYILCPVTCGLSFCLPNMCIKDAEKNLKVHLEYYNEYRFLESGLDIILVKKCSTSWLELRLKDDEKSLTDIEVKGKS